MLIEDLMHLVAQEDTITVDPEVGLASAAQLLVEYNIGALPVVDDEDKILGVISERDIVKAVVRDKMAYDNLRVSDVMSSSVITCRSDDDTKDVCDTLMQKNIRHIPVAVDNKLIMLLSMKDFLKFPTLQ